MIKCNDKKVLWWQRGLLVSMAVLFLTSGYLAHEQYVTDNQEGIAQISFLKKYGMRGCDAPDINTLVDGMGGVYSLTPLQVRYWLGHANY